MSTSEEDKAGNIFRVKPKRKFYVFLVSLILASSFWLLNALNKTYVETAYMGLKYINLPENKAYSRIPPSFLKVQLSGDGYSLINILDESTIDTVVIDLSELEFINNGSYKKASLATDNLISSFKSSLSNGVNISDVNRDTIHISIERGEDKEVPIIPNHKITLEKGMVLIQPPYTNPTSVNIHGPVSATSKIEGLETEFVSLEEVSESVIVAVPLVYNQRIINPEHRVVELMVDVEALTEGEIEVPIEVIGIPNGKRLRLIPNKVKLKYTTGLSHFDFIKSSLFHLTVNYEDIKLSNSKLSINLVSSPTYVNVIQFIPERVDFLILDE